VTLSVDHRVIDGALGAQTALQAIVDNLENPMAMLALIVCASPRTGSTLLCGLLASSGVAGRPESYFRAEDRDEYAGDWGLARDATGRFDFARYLAAARVAATTRNGVAAIRVMGPTRQELLTDLGALWPDRRDDLALLGRAFGRVRFLHLTRADRLAQAVSRVRAQQTGLWHRFGGKEERDPGKPRRARHDRAAIARYVAEAEAEASGWARWFDRHGIRPIRVGYEALASSPVPETLRILQELGLDMPPGIRIAASSRRLADRTTAAWIARYRAEAQVSGSS
jgi:trehalose 2-sulfotransferase